MAKKPPRSGGRVTPKGTRPVESSKSGSSKAQPTIDHRLVNRFDPAQNQRGGGPTSPTRAGHHRGQR